jgi:hypothetical protein
MSKRESSVTSGLSLRRRDRGCPIPPDHERWGGRKEGAGREERKAERERGEREKRGQLELV